MKTKLNHRFIVTLALLSLLGASIVRASDQSDVRSTVQRVFEQLKSHDYNGLYDVLPGSSRNRMSRERFTNALQRAQEMYELDRMDIGRVKVMGNLAVVDTVLYGRLVKPLETEGKIVVQQYLVREDGHWRVATGDQSTVRKFLAANPVFAKGFKIHPPEVFIKQEGKWVQFTRPNRQPRT